MKKLVAMVFLMAAFGSQASYMQETCSNADGSVKINMGHSSTGVILETMTMPRDSRTSPVAYDYRDINVETTDAKVLDTKMTSGCAEGSHGISSYDRVEVKKVTITQKDGSLFPAGTISASDGGKSVSVYVVCKRHSNYMTYCPANR